MLRAFDDELALMANSGLLCVKYAELRSKSAAIRAAVLHAIAAFDKIPSGVTQFSAIESLRFLSNSGPMIP
jgi:hypothetical protein